MTAAMIGAAAGLVTVAGPVLVYLMRIEHRLTRMEVNMAHLLAARGVS